jgi:DNA-binding transcriptional LysR family regulator
MEVRRLEVFLAVVEEGSVTAGARRLFLAQPAVTRHLQALERQVGYSLLQRSNKGVELTDAGRALAVEARRIVAAADRVLAEARSLRSVISHTKRRLDRYTIGIHDEGLAELTLRCCGLSGRPCRASTSGAQP